MMIMIMTTTMMMMLLYNAHTKFQWRVICPLKSSVVKFKYHMLYTMEEYCHIPSHSYFRTNVNNFIRLNGPYMLLIRQPASWRKTSEHRLRYEERRQDAGRQHCGRIDCPCSVWAAWPLTSRDSLHTDRIVTSGLNTCCCGDGETCAIST
jgi:hypothetical protein